MAPFLSHLRMVSMNNNSINFNCKWWCYEEQIYVTNAANQHQHLVWYKYPQLKEKAHGNTHVECFPNQGHPGLFEGSLYKAATLLRVFFAYTFPFPIYLCSILFIKKCPCFSLHSKKETITCQPLHPLDTLSSIILSVELFSPEKF